MRSYTDILDFFSRNHPKVMFIANLTTDSFYSKSRFSDLATLVERCSEALSLGVEMIDLGAFSTRPGFSEVPLEEELSRLLPALQAIRKEFPDALISVDTFRSEVAERVVAEGADVINDVTAGSVDSKMFPFMAKNNIPYILTFNEQGSVREAKFFFEKKIEELRTISGLTPPLILDPGIGFGKTIDENFALVGAADAVRVNNYPVLLGISRKSLIYKTLNLTPEESLNGTTVLNTIALHGGADILRVHDAKEALQTVKLFLNCSKK